MKNNNPNQEKVNLNFTFKQIMYNYKSCKKFLAFSEKLDRNMLHEKSLEEEILYRKKYILNVECSLAILSDLHNKILMNEINNENNMWYVGTLSRSTYYRNRQKAIESFLETMSKFETVF